MSPRDVTGYSTEPTDVARVETKHRRIVSSKLPVPESMPELERLWSLEARSLAPWQFPVLWQRAKGYQVFDPFGNVWLDASAGIAVANAGHAPDEVICAIVEQANSELLYNFTFPSRARLRFLEKLVEFASDVAPHLEKAFLMSAGSEACENVLKLARRYQHVTHGPHKNVVVTFEGAFHGRTLGAQMMGGLPELKDWIVHHDPDLVQVPFPDGFYNEETSFEGFVRALDRLGVEPARVAAVFVEPAQGANVHLMPVEYARKLREWCDDHEVLLCFDEVQTGFGRMGHKFGHLHYGVEADLISLGKGISGSLPLSATLGRAEIMDVFPPGHMTSTHTGNAICCAAGTATLEIYEREGLVERAAELGAKVLQPGLRRVAERHEAIGVATGVGLFAGIQVVEGGEAGAKVPDKQGAYEVNQRLCQKGVMMFAPVGKACCKFAPPLVIPEDALVELVEVVDEAVEELEAEGRIGPAAARS
ncbi:MAG: acetyl ornithine aminotransferase family protein [Promethearchaeota archaeon]